MATIKRTTTTSYRAPAPRPPYQRPEPEPEPEPSEPGYEASNRWPDNPPDVDPEAEQLPVSEVVPVGVEQLERSREMQEMGIANWVAAHDERGPDYQQEQVAGVTPLER
jgi:hypothetical protein